MTKGLVVELAGFMKALEGQVRPLPLHTYTHICEYIYIYMYIYLKYIYICTYICEGLVTCFLSLPSSPTNPTTPCSPHDARHRQVSVHDIACGEEGEEVDELAAALAVPRHDAKCVP